MNLSDLNLPEKVKNDLKSFSEEISGLLGSELVSLSVYGSAVTGNFSEDVSDINVLLVVKEVLMSLLRKIAPAVEKAEDNKITIFLVTEGDMLSSCDVFPIKFMEIKRHHLVIIGSDIASKLPICNDHLRLRAEQELKNIMFRLRQAYLKRYGTPDFMKNNLAKFISPYLKALKTMIYLKTGSYCDDVTEALKQAESLFQIKKDPLEKILSLRKGKLNLSYNEIEDLYGEFLEVVQHSAKQADKLEN